MTTVCRRGSGAGLPHVMVPLLILSHVIVPALIRSAVMVPAAMSLTVIAFRRIESYGPRTYW